MIFKQARMWLCLDEMGPRAAHLWSAIRLLLLLLLLLCFVLKALTYVLDRAHLFAGLMPLETRFWLVLGGGIMKRWVGEDGHLDQFFGQFRSHTLIDRSIFLYIFLFANFAFHSNYMYVYNIRWYMDCTDNKTSQQQFVLFTAWRQRSSTDRYVTSEPIFGRTSFGFLR